MNSLTKPKIINEYFQENGYVLVEDVFDPHKILDPIISEYENVLDDLCRELYKQKEIKSARESISSRNSSEFSTGQYYYEKSGYKTLPSSHYASSSSNCKPALSGKTSKTKCLFSTNKHTFFWGRE